MKNQIIIIASIFGLLLSTTSCKKEETILTKIDLISQHIWKLDDTTVSADCEEDDRHTFAKSGSYVSDPGIDLCVEEEVPTTGSWEFLEGETILSVTLNEGGISVSIESEIITLNEEKLIIDTGFGIAAFVPAD